MTTSRSSENVFIYYKNMKCFEKLNAEELDQEFILPDWIYKAALSCLYEDFKL